jgi:plastocyanin
MRTVRIWASRLAGAAVAIALLAAIAGLTLIGTDSASATHVVSHVIVGQTIGPPVANGVNRYNAPSITITAGDTVTWASAPDGRSHDVQSAVLPAGAVAFFSGNMDSDAPPATFARALTTAGTYTYYCTLHASASDATLANVDANMTTTMVGKIVVQAPAPDTTAPTTTAVAAVPNPTDGAASVTLTATVTDSGTPLGTIASAQYRIDAGAPVAMTAVDGIFNGATENVQASVPVGSLALGLHTVEVQGTDNAANIGAWVALAGGLTKTNTPAGAVVASVTVLAGALTNTAQNVAFGNVTLGGADQTIPATAAVWQAKDARGTGAGWNVTLSSTNFTGAGTIAVSNFKVRQPQAQVVAGAGSSTAPSSQVLSFQSLSATPLKLLSATGGAGMGTYDYTPDFQLTVPASTAAGAHTANVTVSINTGPESESGLPRGHHLGAARAGRLEGADNE